MSVAAGAMIVVTALLQRWRAVICCALTHSVTAIAQGAVIAQRA